MTDKSTYYIEVAYPCESRLAEKIVDAHETAGSNVVMHAAEGGVVCCMSFDSKLRYGTAVSEAIEQADAAIDNAVDETEADDTSLSEDPWYVKLVQSDLMTEALLNQAEDEAPWLARKDDDGLAGTAA